MFFLPMTPDKPVRELDNRDRELSGIPEPYWGLKLDAIPDEAQHKAELAKWCAKPWESVNRGFGLLLHGETGQGKTSCACIFGQATKARGGAVWFSRADQIASAVVKEWDHPDEQYTQQSYWQNRANVWIIDDLANALGQEQSRAIIEREIRERLSAGRSIVVTTNTLDFSKLLGEQTLRAMKAKLATLKVVSGSLFNAGQVEKLNNWRREFLGGKA